MYISKGKFDWSPNDTYTVAFFLNIFLFLNKLIDRLREISFLSKHVHPIHAPSNTPSPQISNFLTTVVYVLRSTICVSVKNSCFYGLALLRGNYIVEIISRSIPSFSRFEYYLTKKRYSA